jgi:hypothetical protein
LGRYHLLVEFRLIGQTNNQIGILLTLLIGFGSGSDFSSKFKPSRIFGLGLLLKLAQMGFPLLLPKKQSSCVFVLDDSCKHSTYYAHFTYLRQIHGKS